MSESQNNSILEHLKNIGSITPLEALKLYGCFRLGARCYDLKKMGFNIKTEIVKDNGKHFAKYSLETQKIEVNGQLMFV